MKAVNEVFSKGKGQREGRKDPGKKMDRKNETNIACSLSYVELRFKNIFYTYICTFIH